jgi:putative ABC transport system permease protein
MAVGRTADGRTRRAARSVWFALAAILLVGAGVALWTTTGSNYTLVLAPEGVPSISVDYRAFLGPALFWAGAGLLTWRLVDLLLDRGRPVMAWLLRPVGGVLAPTIAAMFARQRRLLARGVVLVALSLSFAVSTAIFNSTYQQQSEVDARLTNGADVTVTESPGAQVGPDAVSQLAVPGVRSVEPLQHRFAYVGTDLQDIFGVRPQTVAAATSLRDGYFQGGTASQLLGRLAARPDGILVSAETVKDFQLTIGDQLNLRLQDARTNKLVTVPFDCLGIAKEFPTAPKDSFLIANASYITKMTGSDAVGAFLVNTGGSATTAVASRLRATLAATATVTDIAESRRVVGSSLTAVDLDGLTRIELGFAIVLGAAAGGLVLALGFAERRRAFSILATLGSTTRQLAGVLVGEALVTVAAGLLAGALAGWALAQMLVAVLTGVFDPPPDQLAVPWSYLAGLVVVTLVALAAAVLAATARASRATATDLREG